MHPLRSAASLLGARIRALRQDRRGNISILFGLSLVPMVGLAGLGVDYGIAISAKSKLDNAADAAALAAVATAKAYVAAHASDSNVNDAAKTAGLDRAKRAFAVNAGSVSFAAVPTPTITLTRSGQTFSSAVSYTTTTTTQLGRMFGQSALNVGGSAAASADVPSYIDFYIMVDESGSMGIPTASADQTKLAGVNGNCQFACHFADSKLATESAGKWGYNIATTGYTKKKASDGTYVNDQQVLSAPLQLRAGAVNNALCQLLTRAATPAVTSQYRVGIYPFVDQLGVLASLTSNVVTLQTTADCGSSPPMALTKLLDSGETQLPTNGDPTTGTGSGGTRFDNAMPTMKALVSPIGDGSTASNPKPFVFLITDGLDNGQHYSVKSGSSYMYVGNPNTKYQSYTTSNAGFDGSSPQQIQQSWCTQLKSSGVTLSILYIPYVTLAVGATNADETNKVNGLIPALSSNLQSCASSGFFYTASSQTDITAALNAMFNQAVQVAHLSK